MLKARRNILDRKMIDEPLLPLLVRLSLPCIISLAITSLYSLADSFFVSHLGKSAVAAVGVCFSIQIAAQAIGYTVGMGAGSHISRALGGDNRPKASQYASCAILLSLLLGALLACLGLAFKEPLLRILGTTEETMPKAEEYATYLLLSTPALATSLTVSQLLRAEGHAVYAMTGLLCGGGLNIALDYIFVDRMLLGLQGASLASLLGQLTTLPILLSAYWRKASDLQLFAKKARLTPTISGKILYTGLPSAIRQGLTAMATILINRIAAAQGDGMLNAISISAKIFLLLFSTCLGIGQGLMPIVGFLYGAGRRDRVKRAYLEALLLSVGTATTVSVFCMVFAPQIVSMFRQSEEVLQIGALALRLQVAVLPLHGIITCTIMLLQALGKPIGAGILAGGRQGFFFLPALHYLSMHWGKNGIAFVQPAADIATFLLAIPFAILLLRQLKNQGGSQK